MRTSVETDSVLPPISTALFCMVAESYTPNVLAPAGNDRDHSVRRRLIYEPWTQRPGFAWIRGHWYRDGFEWQWSSGLDRPI